MIMEQLQNWDVRWPVLKSGIFQRTLNKHTISYSVRDLFIFARRLAHVRKGRIRPVLKLCPIFSNLVIFCCSCVPN